MTTIYFIRHAESDFSVHDDLTRPLSAKGLRDRVLVTEYLKETQIDAVFSSPYKRAIDTVSDFAESRNLPIEIMEDFRERKVGDGWIDNFMEFSAKQWADFSYKLPGGECLGDVQKRNITALGEILTGYKDKNIVIGTHGTALSVIMNYYDRTYGYDDFLGMIDLMPWVVKVFFDENGCQGMEKIDLFNL